MQLQRCCAQPCSPRQLGQARQTLPVQLQSTSPRLHSTPTPAARRAPFPARSAPAAAAVSVDPLEAQAGPFKFGKVHGIHSQQQLDALLEQHKDRLTVLMCKSSHCRPCKAFARKYHELAERFSDSVLLHITGDESPECRKLMKDWGVKVTPTFRLFRNGEFVESCTGVKNEGEAITTCILKHLGANERGRDWVAPTSDNEEITNE